MGAAARHCQNWSILHSVPFFSYFFLSSSVLLSRRFHYSPFFVYSSTSYFSSSDSDFRNECVIVRILANTYGTGNISWPYRY